MAQPPLGFLDATTAPLTADQPRPEDLLLGVPLALWGVRALSLVLPKGQIVAACDRPRVAKILEGAGVRTIEGTQAHELEPPSLVASIHLPFCSKETAVRALASSRPDLAHQQTGAIERIRLHDQEHLAFAETVAAGMGNTHPALIGIHSLRPGLSSPIDLVVCDVDGTLTDGSIILGDHAEPLRRFDTKDGLGTKLLINAGVRVAWLTATTRGGSTRARGEMLGIEDIDIDPGHKGPRFSAMCERLGVDPGRALFFGDDVNDLPAMSLAGASACPADAHGEVRAAVDIVLTANGGHGAMRELADLVLAARGKG